MKFQQSVFHHLGVLAVLILIAPGPGGVVGSGGHRTEEGLQRSSTSGSSTKEEAYRLNNIGVAELEQYKYEEAAAKFREALKIDPGLAIGHLNLSIALFNEPDLPGALAEAKIAAGMLPKAPQPQYMLGLIARSQNRVEDAISAFTRVLSIDPNDVATNVNLGQLYAQQRKYPEAIAVLNKAVAGEPYNITAVYNLAISLLRSGQRDEGQRMMERFTRLRTGGYG